MNTTLSPLLYNEQKDINDVHQFTEHDAQCLKEIKSVLEKYGNTNRFGLTLLHKHFDLEKDEMLVETIDVENRILTVRPVKKDSKKPTEHLIQTSWSFTNDPVFNTGCESFCPTDANGNHDGYRDHY